MQLIYSPDDRGWYWQRVDSDWQTSQLFKTREAAERARQNGTLRWES